MITIAQAKAFTQNLLDILAQRYSDSQVTYAPGLIDRLNVFLKHKHLPIVLYAEYDDNGSTYIRSSTLDEILNQGIPYTRIQLPGLNRPIMLGENL